VTLNCVYQMVRWENVSQNRSRMIIRSICNFKTRGERSATMDNKRRQRLKGMKEKSGGKKVDQF